MRTHALALPAVVAVLLAAWGGPVRADRIVLKDGTTHEGKKVAEGGGKVAYLIGGKLRWFAQDDIAQILADGASTRPAGGAKGHEIHLDRAFRVGDEYRLLASAEFTSVERSSRGGQALDERTEKLKVRLEADVKVLSVDRAGRPLDIELAVRAFDGSIDGKPAVLAGERLVIVAESGGEGTQFKLAGAGKLDPNVSRLLDLAVALSDANAPEDDSLFGTSTERAVGETWPVNRDAMARAASAQGLSARPEDVRGTLRLAELRTVGKTPCLHIEGQVSIGKLSPPLPPGGKVLDANMTMAMSGDFPTDPNLPALSGATQTRVHLHFQVPAPDGGGAIEMRVDQTASQGRKLTPTKWPRGDDAQAAAAAHPLFQGEKVDVDLPEPSNRHAVGGQGRLLFFHLKGARKVAVVDVSLGRIVEQIGDMPDDVLIAAGAEKLMLVMPSAKMMQRYDLKTLQREKVAPIPGSSHPIRIALMGESGTGPLMLWSDGAPMFLDVPTLRPLTFRERVPTSSARYGYVARVSADGRTFTGIAAGIGPVAYHMIRIEGRRLRTGSFGGTSHANRWAQPTADGALFLLPGGGFFSAGLRPVTAKELEGSTCYATPEPAYFLSVRFDGSKTRAGICTTADRKVLHTNSDMDEMVPRGNTNARYSIERRLQYGEPHFYYFPAVNVLANLHWGRQRLTLRRLNLAELLDARGEGFLFVTSAPPTVATPGRAVRYQV